MGRHGIDHGGQRRVVPGVGGGHEAGGRGDGQRGVRAGVRSTTSGPIGSVLTNTVPSDTVSAVPQSARVEQPGADRILGPRPGTRPGSPRPVQRPPPLPARPGRRRQRRAEAELEPRPAVVRCPATTVGHGRAPSSCTGPPAASSAPAAPGASGWCAGSRQRASAARVRSSLLHRLRQQPRPVRRVPVGASGGPDQVHLADRSQQRGPAGGDSGATSRNATAPRSGSRRPRRAPARRHAPGARRSPQQALRPDRVWAAASPAAAPAAPGSPRRPRGGRAATSGVGGRRLPGRVPDQLVGEPRAADRSPPTRSRAFPRATASVRIAAISRAQRRSRCFSASTAASQPPGQALDEVHPEQLAGPSAAGSRLVVPSAA